MKFVVSQPRPPREPRTDIPERNRKIVAAIIEHNYTLESVAAVTGYNKSSIDKIVAGKSVRERTIADFEGALGLPRGGYELTPRGRATLRRLLELHEKYPDNKTWGFPSNNLGGCNTSACRKNLEALGLVHIRRSNGISRGFRYMLTDAGFTEARKLKERRK